MGPMDGPNSIVSGNSLNESIGLAHLNGETRGVSPARTVGIMESGAACGRAQAGVTARSSNFGEIVPHVRPSGILDSRGAPHRVKALIRMPFVQNNRERLIAIGLIGINSVESFF